MVQFEHPLLMAKTTKPKGGDPAKRAEAAAQIDTIIGIIDDLWKKAAKIADKNVVSFTYSMPGDPDSGGQYIPKRPDDWHNYDEEEGEPPYESDINKDHPEYMDYHPWNDSQTYDGREYDWSSGNWISSSERC